MELVSGLGDDTNLRLVGNLFDNLVGNLAVRVDNSLESAALHEEGFGGVILWDGIGVAVGAEHALAGKYSFDDDIVRVGVFFQSVGRRLKEALCVSSEHLGEEVLGGAKGVFRCEDSVSYRFELVVLHMCMNIHGKYMRIFKKVESFYRTFFPERFFIKKLS